MEKKRQKLLERGLVAFLEFKSGLASNDRLAGTSRQELHDQIGRWGASPAEIDAALKDLAKGGLQRCDSLKQPQKEVNVVLAIETAVNKLEKTLVAKIEKALSCLAAEYLSIAEAAKVLSLSDSHIRRAISSGELPASNVGSAARPTWRIAVRDLGAWMESKKGERSVVPPSSELKGLIERHLPGLRGRNDSATR